MESFSSKNTKELLKQTFLTCLLKRPTKRITVKEICEVVGCSRKTFYRYFDTSFDIHVAVVEDLLFWLKPTFIGVVLNLKTNTSKKDSLQIYDEVKKKHDIYKKLVLDKVFEEVFIKKCMEMIADIMTSVGYYTREDIRFRLILETIVSTLFIVFKWNILNNMINIDNTKRNARDLLSDEMMKSLGIV